MSARVLHVLEPPDGGVAQAVLDLASGLPDLGVACEVAGPAGSPVADRAGELGVPFHALPYDRGYGDPRADARALHAITRLARSGRFDIVHGHAAKAGMLGRIAARAARRPAVYSPHCLPFVGEVSRERYAGSVALERAARPLTSALLCVCEAERELALRHRLVPPARAHVVPNGAHAPAPGVAPDPRLEALRGDGVLAAAVTVLRRQKGLPDLLEAAPRVLDALPEARIAIVGEGPEEAALRARAAELGLDAEPRFALLPYEGPAARHLLALDVYVLPSRWEALPIGLLEAMACGVPQVATDVGGTGEALTDETGILVPPGDPAALAEALIALLGDRERRERLRTGSRARHAEHFSLARMVAGTAGVYAAVSGAASTDDGRRATP